MARLLKYAEDKHIVYVREFPIYLQVEIVGAGEPELRASMEKWLFDHGFQKGLGAAFDTSGKLTSQQYLFGDTFDLYISTQVASISLSGYGIRTDDQNAEPVLRKLLEFIEAHYKTARRELISL